MNSLFARMKLTAILSLAIFPPLIWMLALSNAGAPLVQSAGIYGCIACAAAIALVSAWLIVGFIIELREVKGTESK